MWAGPPSFGDNVQGQDCNRVIWDSDSIFGEWQYVSKAKSCGQFCDVKRTGLLWDEICTWNSFNVLGGEPNCYNSDDYKCDNYSYNYKNESSLNDEVCYGRGFETSDSAVEVLFRFANHYDVYASGYNSKTNNTNHYGAIWRGIRICPTMR